MQRFPDNVIMYYEAEISEKYPAMRQTRLSIHNWGSIYNYLSFSYQQPHNTCTLWSPDRGRNIFQCRNGQPFSFTAQ